MLKRIISLCLAAALLLALSACGNLFEREYLYVSDYSDGDSADEALKISSSEQLKNAVLDMVSAHLAEDKFIFNDYEGDLQSDLAQLGWQIKSEDALSGYCVDYISYDLNRIVNYYEAQVQISYKRTAEEVEAIIPVSSAEEFKAGIAKALENCGTHAAFRWKSEDLTPELVSDLVWEAFSQNPAACAATPEMSVALYYTDAVAGIVSVDLNYGYDSGELQGMKASLSDALKAYTQPEGTEGEALVRALSLSLSGSCEYSLDAGSSAYDALVQKKANSEGMALGLSVLCKANDISCWVIRGELYGEEHCWCIVGIGSGYYHLDPSESAITSILRSDTQMRNAGYRWNAGSFPICSNP